MTNLIFSLDLEVDGLDGAAFAAAAVVADAATGEILDKFEGRCELESFEDSWVEDNILPAISSMEVNFASSEDLEEALWAFYAQYCVVEGEWGPSASSDVEVIAHCGNPVETGFFNRAVARDKSRTFQRPLPLHEVGTLLLAVGENPTSVDSYLKKYELTVEFDGPSHHPLFDSYAALAVWSHIKGRFAQ